MTANGSKWPPIQDGRQIAKSMLTEVHLYKLKTKCYIFEYWITENYIIVPSTNIYIIVIRNPRWPPFIFTIIQ